VCALAACGGDEAPGRGAGPPEGGPPPPAVEVVTLTPEAFHETAALLGELRAVESVVIKSEMAGVIERIAFEEGQPVAKGTVLFELRDDERLARLHEAEAQLALAQDEFERTRLLASRNAAAEVQLARDRAELAVAQARLERYRAEWERTRIRAPFDGLVGARQVSPGARITPEDPLVRIDAVDPVELVFTIPEAVLPLARIGSPFELKVASYPERWFPGTLSFIAPSVDSQTRRVLLKGRVPNPGHTLLPGMFAEVRAALEEREAFLVPEEALGTDPDGFFVWRIGPDDGAERVPVEVGARDSGRVEIRAELRPGDRIVSAGTHKVRAGEKVRPVAAAVAPGGTPASSAASVPRSGA
jgi:membrane fusion protein (multidrug efflux system)